MEQGDQVQALIWQMVCSVVDTPNRVKVEAVIDNRLTPYLVQVKENEIGQVIGKQGRVARALRTILAVIAMKEKRQIELDIAIPSTPFPATQIQEKLEVTGSYSECENLLPQHLLDLSSSDLPGFVLINSEVFKSFNCGFGCVLCLR